MEIWEPKPPGTLWATPGVLWDSFTLDFGVPLLPKVQVRCFGPLLQPSDFPVIPQFFASILLTKFDRSIANCWPVQFGDE